MSNSSSYFKRVAFALAFSPRCEALVAEAKRMQEAFHCELLFVHVGQKSLQEEQYLKHLLHRFQLEDTSKIIWRDGEPVESILEFCQEESIDLLVAGALEKESLLKYFLGGVSRQLTRRVKCSMLMLTEPNIHPKGYAHLVVEGTDHVKTENTISAALEWAKLFGSSKMDIIQESDLSKIAVIRREELKENEADIHKEAIIKEAEEKLLEILKCRDCGSLQIHTEHIEGKPGYVITQYARGVDADLLVLNSPDKQMNLLDRVFPHDIEFALADLPCSLLLVHPKETEVSPA